MEPNITEFSYGYALTEELIRWNGNIFAAAPYFPNLRQEGQLGYDVRLDKPGYPIFLQFKLSHYMKRANAREISQYNLFPEGTRFYRMYLRPRAVSKQHQRLFALGEREHYVYYASPAFHEQFELNNAYLNHEVRTRSVFIRPRWIGPLPDDEKHHVAFSLHGHCYFLSEPREISRNIYYEAFKEDILTGIRPGDDKSLGDKLQTLINQLMDILWEEIDEEPRTVASKKLKKYLLNIKQDLTDIKTLSLVDYMARTLFDCKLLLVGSKQNRI